LWQYNNKHQKGEKMKRTIMFLAITAAIICGSSSISSAAVCDTMDVMLVGDTGMWVRNATAASCGTIAPGTQVRVVFNEQVGDRQLAIALTAFSLDQQVYINFEGDGSGGASVLNVISMRK
jgi:hypothetical protein